MELLVVMAIMALMLGLALPAMNALSRANAVSSGATQLNNVLNLARAKAISERSHVRVVFSDGANTNAAILGNLSYGVLLWTNQTADVVGNWVYVGRWQTLPLGAYFPPFTTLTRTSSVSFPTNGGVPPTSMPYIEYKSTGGLASSTATFYLSVQEGTMVNGSLRGAANAANTVSNQVNWITGKARVMR